MGVRCGRATLTDDIEKKKGLPAKMATNCMETNLQSAQAACAASKGQPFCLCPKSRRWQARHAGLRLLEVVDPQKIYAVTLLELPRLPPLFVS